MLLGCPRPCCPKQNTLKAHQRERVPAPPPVDWSWGGRTVLAVKGSLRRAKQRRALDYCAPFRPVSRRDGRLRREHFAARPKSKRPASLLRRKAGLKTKKTNPSNRGGLDRSLHIRSCTSARTGFSAWKMRKGFARIARCSSPQMPGQPARWARPYWPERAGSSRERLVRSCYRC